MHQTFYNPKESREYPEWVQDHKRQHLAKKIERFRSKYGESEFSDHRCRQALAVYLGEMSGPALQRAIDFILNDKD
jgi:hypothetical protein